jgi:hypothetical protein
LGFLLPFSLHALLQLLWQAPLLVALLPALVRYFAAKGVRIAEPYFFLHAFRLYSLFAVTT